MPSGRWFIISFADSPRPYTYACVHTTDDICHLWLRYSFNKPQRHYHARTLRGLVLMADTYYCFTGYIDIEQEEAGDTLTHTFIVTPMPACRPFWFYFHGQVAGVNSPSTSPIFGRHLFITLGTFSARITNPNDEAQYSSPSLLSCPDHCPQGLAVGRSTDMTIKLGAAIRFRDFQVPKYAEILLAHFYFTCNWTKFVTFVYCQISVEDTSTPDDWAYADVPEFLARWGGRIGVINWDHIPGWTKDVIYQSPNVSPTLQALVNRSDWQSGNNASFFWDDVLQRTPWSALAIRRCYSYQQTPVNCPSIYVTFNHWQVERIL